MYLNVPACEICRINNAIDDYLFWAHNRVKKSLFTTKNGLEIKNSLKCNTKSQNPYIQQRSYQKRKTNNQDTKNIIKQYII